MSKDIFQTKGLIVTAFVGPESQRHCIQLTLESDLRYVQLNEAETLKLIHALLARIVGIEGYNATDL